MSTFDEFARQSVEASIETKRRLVASVLPALKAAADLLVESYRQGGKAIFFGNGGSAADAQHLAAEMECRFAFDRPPLPALALHANTSSLTAISNDYAYDQVFARPLRAHCRPVNVVVAISTSGTSRNVIAAASLKEELGFKLVALTGSNGAPLGRYADVLIAVPSSETPRIQESHILIGHILCEWVERTLFGTSSPSGDASGGARNE